MGKYSVNQVWLSWRRGKRFSCVWADITRRFKRCTSADDTLLSRCFSGTGITPAQFWAGFIALVAEIELKNWDFLLERGKVKAQLDNWYILNRGVDFNFETVQNFLKEIGYVFDEWQDFKIATQGTGPENTQIERPQLVVLVTKAPFVLNVANMR